MNAKDIAKVLSLCRFNPKKDKDMQIIMEANNKEYYRLRAIECIHANEYVKAIRLLVLAFLMRD